MSGETMKFDRDDWRLSAYVAGELDGDERAAVERLLAEDAAARAFVEELRAAAGALEEALTEEEAPALSEAQRASVVRPRRVVGWRHAAAAAVLVAAAAGLSVDSASRFGGGEAEEWRPVHRSRVGETSVASATTTTRDPYEEWLDSLGYQKGTMDASLTPALRSLQALGYLAGPSDGAFRGPGDSVPPGRGRLLSTPATEATREEYAAVEVAGFRRAADEALSTFSIDVDTASYANVRRFLREGTLPPPGAVRVEEFVNAFTYDDPAPTGDVPFQVTTEVAACPWAPRHRLVRIGLKGRSIDWSERKPANLVFLVDVSGSMSSADKLPLLTRSLRLLARQLDHRDRVSIVVYAGAAGLVLPPTPGNRDGEIAGALERLRAGGSTNGGAGIELAYRLAEENLVPGGLNRVILATDGDFNVGVSDQSSLVEMIERKRESGVFLTVLGFGRGNLNDATMEQLADKGNGSYGYVDSLDEAKRLLVEQVGGTMIPVAKDV
ncbi:MAG: von Willebrand factor type A domain-containing protein [Planctomycetota bacterium JB042]